MEINNKEYEVTADIEFALMEELTEHGDDFKVLRKAFKHILIPAPSDKLIDKFKQSDVFRIMDEFGKAQKKLSIEFKKKLSLL